MPAAAAAAVAYQRAMRSARGAVWSGLQSVSPQRMDPSVEEMAHAVRNVSGVEAGLKQPPSKARTTLETPRWRCPTRKATRAGGG